MKAQIPIGRARFAADLQLRGFAQDHAQPGAHDVMIIHDHDAEAVFQCTVRLVACCFSVVGNRQLRFAGGRASRAKSTWGAWPWRSALLTPSRAACRTSSTAAGGQPSPTPGSDVKRSSWPWQQPNPANPENTNQCRSSHLPHLPSVPLPPFILEKAV
jgi:hypothetical protein